jgi:hypothetical protein
VKICDRGLGFECTYGGLSKCTQFCKAGSSLVVCLCLALHFVCANCCPKFSGTVLEELELCVDRSCFGIAN